MSSAFASVEGQLSLLLFAALAGYWLATRINQSATIGQILIGFVMGPSLLNWITYTDLVENSAHVGSIILLFVIGHEFKWKDVFNFQYGVIALVGIIVPWIGGFLTAKAFGYEFGNAVFTGTALTATSIAITAQVLKEMGQLQTGPARAIIGAAVIDDVLGLLALSLSRQLVDGAITLTTILVPVISAALFVVLAIYVGDVIFRRLLQRLDDSPVIQMYPEFSFILVMMFVFVYATIAEMLQLSAIVGAFAAGTSLEGLVLKRSKDHKEGAEYLRIIFAGIFFVSLGILVDTRALTADVIGFVTVLTVVAIATKVIGCFLPARLQGMSVRDSAIIGFGMSPRGEVALIIGLIGLNEGLITQNIYTAIVFMTLITTVITPVILRQWFYKGAV